MPCQTEATTSAAKELSQRTIRTILAKLDASRDLIIRTLTKSKILQKSSIPPQQQLLQQQQYQEKLRQQKEEKEMMEKLIARHKMLHEIRMDVYEMKCTALKVMGETRIVPSKPKFVPLRPGVDDAHVNKTNNIRTRKVSFGSALRQVEEVVGGEHGETMGLREDELSAGEEHLGSSLEIDYSITAADTLRD